MNFIVDVSTGSSVVEFLRKHSHDVLSVMEWRLDAEDHEILRLAVKEHRIIITNDKDFGELVFRDRHAHAGVILLRLKDESAKSKVTVIRQLLSLYSNRLQGNFVVATETEVRIKTLNE